jgi:hypothetical protein
VGWKPIERAKLEEKLYEIDPARMPARVLAAKLIKLEQLAAAVRAHAGWRPLGIQRVLDTMPKLLDRGGWEQLAADLRTPEEVHALETLLADEEIADAGAERLTDDDLIRKDFE